MTETAFLRAAAAQPDDDTLRLVYADWLDEQGGEAFATQAAFVRLQVRRARLDVFDPDRAALLEEEAKLLQKHRRDWNGRVHRELHRRGVFGLVDSRRGAIRTWDYHRGMIARVSATPDGLINHTDVVSALGPVQGVEVSGWPRWSRAGAAALEPFFAGVKLLTIRGLFLPHNSRLNFPARWTVPILDLRFVSHAGNVPNHFQSAAGRDLPPVVLFRRPVITSRSLPTGYTQQDSRLADHVADPQNKWTALRLWFADFTGELLDPIRV